MVGKVLAQYQICEKLGEGGMGVVWKARDTHLDRFVALKTLPPETLADPERKRRSVQEAKAASALNHPNIVHIYDVAEADGVQFISMEYVPGKTLDQLIGRKGLRLNEALKYAIQIADALAKAHSAGIIHRDLKPSNIIVSENGHVKVLDFGVAKLTESTRDGLEQTATMKQPDGPRTEEGAIVGTVAYMSPEQAEGKKVDARSDIFSFGSMLYEMVTGRQAFHGDSKMSTLSAILKDEPKPVSAVAADVPRDLEKIVSRCLRKDPDRRYQTMADLKVALQELKEESESGKLTSIAAPVALRPRKSRRIWTLAGTAALLLLAIGGLGWVYVQTSNTKQAHQASRPTVVPLTTYTGYVHSPTFSPDGERVAFVWSGPEEGAEHIYVKIIGENEPQRLTKSAAEESGPAWSPDGRWLAFLRSLPGEGRGVFLVPAIGGPERKVAEVYASTELGLSRPRVSWHPGGKWVAVSDRNSPVDAPAVFLLSTETGEKRRLTSPPADAEGDGEFAISPDGNRIVFSRSYAGNVQELYLLELGADLSPKTPPTRITWFNRYSGSPAWMPDGHSILFASGSSHNLTLWRMDVPPVQGDGLGKPEQVAFGREGSIEPAVSRQGRIAYRQFMFDSDIWRLELRRGKNGPEAVGPPKRLISSTRLDHTARYSPDGKRIAFASDRSGTDEIWVSENDGSNAVQLTSFGGPYTADPVWSADGKWILFYSGADLYRMSAEGGRASRLTSLGHHAPHGATATGWQDNGLYSAPDRAGVLQVWRKAAAKGGQPLQITRNGGEFAYESPDRQLIYYLKPTTPDPESGSLWQMPVNGGEERKLLDTVSDSCFDFAKDGIYFIANQRRPQVQFLSFVTDRISTIATLPAGELAWGFSVSPDGRGLLYSQFVPLRANLMLVEGLR
jgi:eukaryotic-like serine/threonine-protein kinase